MKEENYRKIPHEEFLKYIDKICNGLKKYLEENNLRIDYICPVLRGGGVPAIYISHKLNIVKFAPFQIKYVKYNDGRSNGEILFNPLDSIKVEKEKPVFLVVEGMHSTGHSAEMCITEIKKNYPKAIILYVTVTKAYGYKGFSDIVSYEDVGFYYNRRNKEYSMEECEKLGIEYYNPLFPWETFDIELTHPDDLEDNIFF